VTAIVALRPGVEAAAEDLQTYCRANLAGYKVPKRVHFVDQVPRQPSGKPDYRVAKAIAAGDRS